MIDMTIRENIQKIKDEIGPDVILVGATKMNDATRVAEAVASGLEYCGENRVQELLEKNSLGAYEGSHIHFIGRLQKNKVKYIVGLAELIHSADSIELIRTIDKCASNRGLIQDILLEINIGEEANKGGFSKDSIYDVLALTDTLSSVRVRGLMAIPPICTEPAQNRPYFEQMHELFVDIKGKKYDNNSMDFLSMGMSGDYLEAVKCGSNMIRVGTGIFGPRNYDKT